MLSYRHAFHAGNYADLLKHTVLCKCIDHLLKKPSPISYIDTHAGAGLYSLTDAMGQKTGEHINGILRLNRQGLASMAPSYAEIVSEFLPIQQYPGSPLIAHRLLRHKDLLHLFELHPRDHEILDGTFIDDKRARVSRADGHQGLLSLLPTKGRRALVLMDPSYEVKTEYQQVVTTIKDAYRRMSSGVFLIWYPVVNRSVAEKMIKKIIASGIRDLWRYELGVAPDNSDYGMTSSGVLVINGPWTLTDEMASLLPKFAKILGPDGHCKREQLCRE